MLRLKTFGGLSLSSDAGTIASHATQRRKLAILALLSTAPTGLSREKIVAILWPDADESSARAALAQTMYATRRALDVDDLILDAGGALRLNPQIITTDVEAFRACIDRGELEQAVAHYDGPFLDGFHIAGAPDFERWVDAERARYLAQLQAVLGTLTSSARADSRHMDVVRWCRAAAATDPYSTPLAAALVDALTLAGDRSGALVAARVHAALLRVDLGIAPHDSLAAAVARAEGVIATAPADGDACTLTDDRRDSETVVESPPTEPTARSAEAAPKMLRHPTRLRAARRATQAAAGAVVLAGVLGLLHWHSVGESRQSHTSHRQRLVVLPFVAADSVTAAFGVNVSELVGMTLDGVGGFVTTNAAASAHDSAGLIDATLVIRGRVVRDGDRVRITSDLYDSAAAAIPIAHVEVDGADSDMFGLSDRLASGLLAERLGKREGTLIRSAAVTTRSSAALKDYFEGEANYRSLRFSAAIADLRRAVSEDSTFALAYYRMATTADWLNLGDVERDAIRKAVAYSDRLAPRDRAMVLAYQAFANRDVLVAEQRYADLLRVYPDNIEAQLMSAEIEFHFGPMYGRPFSQARDAYQRVLALDPDNIEACVHLARIAASERRITALDSLVRRVVAINPATPQLAEIRALDASMHHDSVTLAHVIHSVGENREVLSDVARSLAQFAQDYPAAVATLRLSAIADPPSVNLPVPSTVVIAALAVAQGRVVKANRELRAGWRADPEALRIRGLAALANIAGMSSGASNVFVDSLWTIPAPHSGPIVDLPGSPLNAPINVARIRAELWPIASILDARRGNSRRALDAAALLDRETGSSDVIAMNHRTALVLRALVPLAHGDSVATLQGLERIPANMTTPPGAELWIRATLLAAAGRDVDADSWYASVSDGYAADEALVPWSLLRRAEVAAKHDDTLRAAALRRRADAILSPRPVADAQ